MLLFVFLAGLDTFNGSLRLLDLCLEVRYPRPTLGGRGGLENVLLSLGSDVEIDAAFILDIRDVGLVKKIVSEWPDDDNVRNRHNCRRFPETHRPRAR